MNAGTGVGVGVSLAWCGPTTASDPDTLVDNLLLESSDDLLLESGDFLLLET